MMRVQKYLSEQGILSRRTAETYIRAGKILINGKKAEIGQQIDPKKDTVEVVGQTEASFTTVLVNKPRGVASSRSAQDGKTVYDLFPQFGKLHIAGRLDKESEGLLILTDDGILAKHLTSDQHIIEKEYEVHVQEKIRGPELAQMERGLKLKDGMTLPAKADKIGPNRYTIVLREGRNHQIRRMADAVQLTVTRLTRKRIGGVKTGRLHTGEFRELTPAEIKSFKATQ